jgi:hypothetical protein
MPVTLRTITAAGLAMAGLVTLAGCQRDEPSVPLPAPPPSGVASVAPTEDPARAAAERDVLTAYAAYREAADAAWIKGDSKAKNLATVVAEPLLGQIRYVIGQHRNAGLIAKGRRVSAPEVTEVDLTGRTPKAVIDDCMDYSQWSIVVKKTGKPAPRPSVTGPSKFLVTAQAKQVSGRWYIAESQGDPSRPC